MSEKGFLLEAVSLFLLSMELPFSILEEKAAISLTFQGHHGAWVCHAEVYEEQQRFIFYSLWPEPIPVSKRIDVAEFITRANHRMMIGNFEMDVGRGGLRFKTGIDVEGDRLSQALIKQVIYANLYTMDQYWPGIDAIISSYMSPKQALENIRGE